MYVILSLCKKKSRQIVIPLWIVPDHNILQLTNFIIYSTYWNPIIGFLWLELLRTFRLLFRVLYSRFLVDCYFGTIIWNMLFFRNRNTRNSSGKITTPPIPTVNTIRSNPPVKTKTLAKNERDELSLFSLFVSVGTYLNTSRQSLIYLFI